MVPLRVRSSEQVLIAALLMFAVARAEAQQGEGRNGFWFGADGGYNRTSLTNCASCEPAGSRYGALRLGGKIGSGILAGAELGLAGGSSGLPSVATLLGTVSVYPARRSGAHVRFGIGALARSAYANVDGLPMPAFMGGIGYDLRMRPGMSIVPSVTVLIGPGSYATTLVRAGLGITFH